MCSDIDQNAAQQTVDAITAQGGRAVAMRCDVSRIEDVCDLAEQSQSWFGGAPTLVITNAGVVAGGTPIGEVSLDDWSWALGINLWGPIHGCHVFTPILREAHYGGIINVASAAAFGASPNLAVYSASKASVLSLSETLAAELSGTGVRVTALCPTFVKTNIVGSGRLTAQSADMGGRVMRWTGISPARVARKCLNAHDRGALYCIPQIDAKIGWRITRLTPVAYTRALGLVHRFSAREQPPAADKRHSVHPTECDSPAKDSHAMPTRSRSRHDQRPIGVRTRSPERRSFWNETTDVRARLVNYVLGNALIGRGRGQAES